MSILHSLLPLALSLSAHGALASTDAAPSGVSPAVTPPGGALSLGGAAPAPHAPGLTTSAPAAPAVGPAPAPADGRVRPVSPQQAISGAQTGLIRIQAPAAAPLDRNAIVDRVARAMSDTRTAQGRFTQVDPEGRPSSGLFYISRPGKVRFEYTTPEPMFIVSDGATVSIEEPRRKAYDAIPLASTPLSLFLRSDIDLRRDGSVSDVSSANGFHYVTLVDRTGEAEGRMVLQFRQSDFALMGWRQIDGTGAETTIRLSDIRQNPPLKASLFLVRDPNDEERR